MNIFRQTAIASLILLSGCALHIDRETRIARAEHTGSIYQVDGSIDLAPGAKADNLSGVSTRITLQQGAQANRLRTVDGAIDLAPRATARGDVMSVDGPVHLAPDAHVLGNVQTLTSPITLTDAVVGGRLETVSGTLRISGASLVSNGIVLRKPNPHDSGADIERRPTVIIGPQAKVMGKVIAERGGTVWISRSAKVGPVEGATVHWFQGDTPPAP
jgi:hypothetical protein